MRIGFNEAAVVTKCSGCERLVGVTKDVSAIASGILCKKCTETSDILVQIRCITCGDFAWILPDFADGPEECDSCYENSRAYDDWWMEDYACENGCCACCGCSCPYYEDDDEEEYEETE